LGEAGRGEMRTVYDGLSFEVVREGETHGNGRLTTEGAVLPVESDMGSGVLSRYRYVEEEGGVRRNRYEGELVRGSEGETQGTTRGRGRRYVGISVTLYAKGEAVAVNRLDTERYAGGTGYLGKDILGSVQGVTDGNGRKEGRYEYDAFGEPYVGDFGNGIGLGYTGKPYDPVTGMYDYGYRDYRAENGRFTTEDPIRDGANWFAYVNNDPVNWIDLWGLEDLSNQDTEDDLRKIHGIPSVISGVDINLFSKTDPNENLDEYAKDVLRFDYMFVVGGHGSPSDIVNSDSTNGKTGPLDANGLTDMIKTNSKYEEGKAVALYSCETGSSPTGLGQQLANQLGVVVFAPNDLMWYFDGGGAPFIGPKDPVSDQIKPDPDYTKQGTMNVFIPQAKTGKER
jgi:RHS repeat-associated protein